MATEKKAPTSVWLITDNKPGHRNQLRGLGERLASRFGASLTWIDANQYPASWPRAIAGLAPAIAGPDPDIIIAAGSLPQRLLLACRRRYKALRVVLMRPALPLFRPDLAIVPMHDDPPDRPDVLVTRGVLNAVTPRSGEVTGQNGLILLGGPSEHYHWNSDDILEQLKVLSVEYPDWHWQVTSSRRTPAPLIETLSSLGLDNLTFHHHEDTGPDWLPATLARSSAVWVSPDSVSMVYEAITSGAPTGLFQLTAKSVSRVVRGLKGLQTDGLVTPWADRARLMQDQARQGPPLWEADRAAQWLMQQYGEHAR